MPRVRYTDFEDCYPQVKVFVGGCVERGDGSSFRRKAHAHNYPNDEHFGWICVRSPKRLYNTAGTGPSQLMLHELAHILTPGHGHDTEWMLKAHSLGYRVGKHYKHHSPVSYRAFRKAKRAQ